jgi:hypothetical protein
MFRLCEKMWMVIGFVLCLFSPVFAYSGGAGTAGSPYQIGTAADWNDLRNTPSHWDKYFILIADVNLQGVALTPVGNSTTKFTGVFDGNDHIIQNVLINSPAGNYVGLFGYIGSGGQIRDLGIEDVNITAANYAGGLAGESYGTITGCYATGKVNIGTGSSAGGLVGWNYSSGNIIDCYTEATVSGYENIGGLVGNNYGDVNDCDADCTVSGYRSIGGLVGLNGATYIYAGITRCSAAGAVIGDGTSSSSSIGGLAGCNYAGSTITESYATAAVTGYSGTRGGGVGGLVGVNSDDVNNCYAAGAVIGYKEVGGLIGRNEGSITSHCYSVGSVSGTVSVGGLMGSNTGTVTACVWDVNTSGRTTSAAGTGKTTVQMKTLATFTAMSWDFTTPIWKICNGTNYPKLDWQASLVGDFVCPDGVDIKDLAYFVDRWLLTDCGANNDCDGTDIKTDGTVNFLDFAMFADNWLE